ncbi:CLUMA_CG001386, isoform A [Clunio marinus]|uniref:Kinesin-like protein n=1 Tax=Clunio marinus TaxID=568069 RepID=A0A1J1HHV6_9DIPT|nr:CLUMA_CG001386, isoform A [Clunio marinus]
MAKINVGIKFRPNLSSDVEKQEKWIVDGKTIKSVDNKHTLQFEHVFGSTSVTEEVYDALAKPIVKKAFKGFNGTIFAYGQTSSGKTHTMIGKNKMPGIIPLAVRDIFHEINKTEDREFVVKIGYIEIYNDKVYDLFEDGKTELSIFESNGHVLVNQKEYVAVSEKEVMKQFGVGNKCKKMTGTKTNKDSSRSHAIFRITIKSQKKDDAEDSRTSSLFLVDLAGSEKPDASATTTFNEGLHINQSLLVLGKIIRELAKKNSSLKRVNFRECKLTRILSPALGGNSYASVICTAAPTVLDETYHTLCFAQNAEKVKTVPVINTTKKAEEFPPHLLQNSSSTLPVTLSSRFKFVCENSKQISPFSTSTIFKNFRSVKPELIKKAATRAVAVNSSLIYRASAKVSDNREQPSWYCEGSKDHVEQFELSESTSEEEQADYEGIIKEKDNIIKKLKDEVRELRTENMEMRTKVEGNNEILSEKEQEIVELKEKIARFDEEIIINSSAIRDSEVKIGNFENQLLKMTEEKNTMKAEKGE